MKRNRLTLDLSIRQPNGTEIALPTTPGREANPTWTANGQWIVYINSGGDVSYVESDCNGTINCADYVLFATEGALENPAWSPDGNWMLVVEKDSPFAPSPTTTGDFLDRLWLIRIYYDNGFVYEDDAQRTLLREAYHIAAPAWTPNSLSAYVEMQLAFDTPPYITRLTRPTVSSTSWTPPLQQQALPVALPGGYPIVVAQEQIVLPTPTPAVTPLPTQVAQGPTNTPTPTQQVEECGILPFYYTPSLKTRDGAGGNGVGVYRLYSDDVNVRSRPSDSNDVEVIGVFWGVAVGEGTGENTVITPPVVDPATNIAQPINSGNQPIYFNTNNLDQFRNVEQQGVQYGNRAEPDGRIPDSSVRVTKNRVFAPLGYSVLNGDRTNSWLLIQYNGSLGWIPPRSYTVINCTHPIPYIEENDLRRDLIAYYDSTLPFSVGADAVAPDPNLTNGWVPFGECVPGRQYSLILRRCAFEVYRNLYNDPRFQDPKLTFGDVVAIVMLGEFGDSIENPSLPFESLTQPQRYFVEAAGRNIAGECAYNYAPSASDPIRCNLRGLMDVLLQVQSFYQVTDINQLLERNGLRYTRFAILAERVFQDTNWRLGASGSVPYQWGNWFATNGNGVYTTAQGILNGTSSVPPNVVAEAPWVYVIPNSSPLLVNGTVFAIRNYSDTEVPAPCPPYTFAITTADPELGQTESCKP
ncbi:MAG: hypothetical protein SF123_07075 [Chloroflexota bacterium]|nr:hypothetical protein [Chloroflexota bacterium]